MEEVLSMLGLRLRGEKTEIQTGFGPLRCIGFAQMPNRYIRAAWDMLQDASEDDALGEYPFMRVEMKMDALRSLDLIEIEQKPCGLGAVIEAHRRYVGRRQRDIIHMVRELAELMLEKTVVLYSPGRTAGAECHSDDHLFAKTVPWHPHNRWKEAVRADTPVIIRSREDEEHPECLTEALKEEMTDNLIMPLHEPEKYPVLKRYGAKLFNITDLRERSQKTGISIANQVRNTLTEICDVHDVDRVVLKPNTGTRAFRVHVMAKGEIAAITRGSSRIREIHRPYSGHPVAQPYITGIGEKRTGIYHVIRIFFVRDRRGEFYPIGGFVVLSRSGCIVHGGTDTSFCLLTIY